MGDPVKKLWQDILAMLHAPFAGELDIIHIVALTGIVIVAAIAWSFLLREIASTAEEL